MKAIFILEGELLEDEQHSLSIDIEYIAKKWGLSSYLDDVIDITDTNIVETTDDGVCKHNNTITNECSDCNEQELNTKKAYKYYELGGYHAVIDACNGGKIKYDKYGFCEPCENEQPIYDNACLTCGTTYNKENK